jgi:hypothetical protein
VGAIGGVVRPCRLVRVSLALPSGGVSFVRWSRLGMWGETWDFVASHHPKAAGSSKEAKCHLEFIEDLTWSLDRLVLEMQPLEELPLIAKNGSPANGATALGPKPFAAH